MTRRSLVVTCGTVRGMRFTLEDVGDVEVPDGGTLADCRPGLVALTGVGALGTAALSVDGYPLGDGQVAGAEPWVPGSVLRIGARRGAGVPDPARLALDAPWHLAVLAGPDAGLVAVPDADGVIRVGRSGAAGAGWAGTGRLDLTDPAVSTAHLLVRATRRGWRVVDTGSANGTGVRGARGGGRGGRGAARLGRGGGRGGRGGSGTGGGRRDRGRPRRRGRRLGDARRDAGARRVGRRRGRRVVAEQQICLGSTLLVVRRRAGSGGASAVRGPAGRPSRPSPATWLVPVLISLVLALWLRSVVPALLGLTSLVPLLGSLHGSDTEEDGERPARSPRRARRRRDPTGYPDPAASAVRAAGAGGGLAEAGAWWPRLREGVAVTGPRAGALAIARALAGAALAEPDLALRFALGTEQAADWSWCRWVGGRPDGPGGRSLLVADGADRSTLHRWSLSRPPGGGLLLLEPDADAVPVWCAWTVDATGGWHRRGGTPAALPTAPAASAAWAEAQGRRAAARDHRLGGGDARLPDRLGLVDLGVPTGPAVRAGWSAQRGAMRSLAAEFAVGTAGPVAIDLLADGPHALVAGTTGAGKSALLQSLVLDLALRHPPERLVVVLVDFKGGAGLGPCRRLPHVVGEVTDLDAALAARALDGLRSELRRREELLRAAGLGDLEELRTRGPAPPRILVVVDELRALRDDLPDVLPALVRLAAQGRSLGIHLVLATQRPGGALDAQVRANVALRICLRVTDPAESADVVDVPDAAALPADRPGRAVLRRGHAEPVTVQTAWAGLAPTTTAVRWAPPWPARARGEEPAPAPEVTVRRLVEDAVAAAVGRPPPTSLWSPPLPVRVTDADLSPDRPDPDRLRFGLADLPDHRAHPAVGWDPSSGALVVLGRPGSGRSTALRAVTRHALRAGRAVHLVRGRADGETPDSSWGEARDEGWGTVVDVRDPLRLVRLLHRLREGAEPGRLLVVDDAAGVLRLLDSLRHGPGADLLVDLVRDAARIGLAAAVAGSPADLLRISPHAGTRLVLATGDDADDAALGVPRGLPARRVPGRGVLLPPGRLVQVSAGLGPEPPGAPESSGSSASGITPGCTAPRRSTRDDDGRHPSAPSSTAREDEGRPRSVPLRLQPLPLDVTLDPADLSAEPTAAPGPESHATSPGGVRLVLGRADDEATEPGRVRLVLGRGGDDAALVSVPLRPGLLVVGPPASGRSTALATAARGLAARPALDVLDLAALVRRPALPVPPDARPSVAPRVRVPFVGTPGAEVPFDGAPGAGVPGDVADRLRSWGEASAGSAGTRVLLVDDLDRVLRARPELDELLAGWLERAEAGEPAPVLLASARTDRAATAFRGVLAALRQTAAVLVLSPLTQGSAEAAGLSLTAATDPAHPHRPGRGVLVRAGRTLPIQVGRVLGATPAAP